MSFNLFFYKLITFIIALFFIVIGIFAILVQASSSIRSDVISFILDDTLFLALFGFISLLVGVAIVFYLLSSFRKRYHTVKSDAGAFYLDESLFQDYMENYWKQLFPNQNIPTHVNLKKNNVQITADLPFVPEAQQKELLSHIDRDLKEIFHEILGYKQNYVISISFQPETQNQ
jgi:predicted membrane protein